MSAPIPTPAATLSSVEVYKKNSWNKKTTYKSTMNSKYILQSREDLQTAFHWTVSPTIARSIDDVYYDRGIKTSENHRIDLSFSDDTVYFPIINI